MKKKRCCICGKTIELEDGEVNGHFLHKPECKGMPCDCDLWAHYECCPICNLQMTDCHTDIAKSVRQLDLCNSE